MAVDLYTLLKKSLTYLRVNLEAAPDLMKKLGALGVAASSKAFTEQALGNWKWLPRYPGQDEPKLNIAGALEDWNAGRAAPKPNRFQDRPAVVDEGRRGGIWGTLSFDVRGPLSFDWGSNKEYSLLHNLGGEVSIPIPEATKERIKNWLYTPGSLKKGSPAFRKGAVKHYGASGNGPVQRTGREAYYKHLKPLLESDVWTQNVIGRPFVGMTDALATDMVRAVEEHFAKKQLGGKRSVG